MPAIKKNKIILQQTFTYIATLFCVLQKGLRGAEGRRERGREEGSKGGREEYTQQVSSKTTGSTYRAVLQTYYSTYKFKYV